MSYNGPIMLSTIHYGIMLSCTTCNTHNGPMILSVLDKLGYKELLLSRPTAKLPGDHVIPLTIAVNKELTPSA